VLNNKFIQRTKRPTVKKVYPKITATYLNNHNLLQLIFHRVNTRYTKNNFIINRSKKKTRCGRHFEIIGTILYNKPPN